MEPCPFVAGVVYSEPLSTGYGLVVVPESVAPESVVSESGVLVSGCSGSSGSTTGGGGSGTSLNPQTSSIT